VDQVFMLQSQADNLNAGFFFIHSTLKAWMNHVTEAALEGDAMVVQFYDIQ
jgi:hypothetical protein